MVNWDFEGHAWDDVIPDRIQQNSYTVIGPHGRYKFNERVQLSLYIEAVSARRISAVFPGQVTVSQRLVPSRG